MRSSARALDHAASHGGGAPDHGRGPRLAGRAGARRHAVRHQSSASDASVPPRRESRAGPRAGLDGARRAADGSRAACRARAWRPRCAPSSSPCASSWTLSLAAPASRARPATAADGDLAWDTLLAEPPDPALVDGLSRRRRSRPWCCSSRSRSVALVAPHHAGLPRTRAGAPARRRPVHPQPEPPDVRRRPVRRRRAALPNARAQSSSSARRSTSRRRSCVGWRAR